MVLVAGRHDLTEHPRDFVAKAQQAARGATRDYTYEQPAKATLDL